MNNVVDQSNVSGPLCEFCGSVETDIAVASIEFEFLHNQEIKILTAEVPTITCRHCAESYLAEGSEEIKHAVVCHFLDRLSPEEILAKRKALGMSQAGLAKATDIGIASIKRWETGLLIQSAALDKRLRDFCVTTLTTKATHSWSPKFRTPVRDESRRRANSFTLRPQNALSLEAA